MSHLLPQTQGLETTSAQLHSQIDTGTKVCGFQRKLNEPPQNFEVTTHVSPAQGLSSQEIQSKTTAVKLLSPPQLSSVT